MKEPTMHRRTQFFQEEVSNMNRFVRLGVVGFVVAVVLVSVVALVTPPAEAARRLCVVRDDGTIGGCNPCPQPPIWTQCQNIAGCDGVAGCTCTLICN
jgi:hypothetical protein